MPVLNRIAGADRDRQRGFVLVLVLWTGLALALGIGSFLARERGEAYRVVTERTLGEATLFSEAAWELALADLDRNRAGRRDGTVTEIRTSDGLYLRYAITDETGKADLNEADPELLQALIADALGDGFRAAGLIDRIRAHREAVDAPRLSLDALAAFGLDKGDRDALSRHVTPFAFSRYINPYSATPETLRAVPGIGPSDVTAILRARARGEAMPTLGSAERWFARGNGPVYTIEAVGFGDGALGHLRRGRIIQIGGGFRGGGGRLVRVGPMTVGAVAR